MVIGMITILGELLIIDVLIYVSIRSKFDVNWLGIAAVFTALSTLAGVLIYGKVRNETSGEGDNQPESEEDGNEAVG